MARSTKDDWLNGPGDLQTAEVEDVPVKGSSVLVRALSARYSADVQAQLKLTQEGREQVAKIDVAEMELLQFEHGVIEPVFTKAEARNIQERYGAAFRKIIAKIDEISGVDKEAIAETEQRFQAGGTPEAGGEVRNGTASGDPRPDLPVPTGG